MQVVAPTAPPIPAEVGSSPPGEREVVVRVEASGICGADVGQLASTEPEGGFPIVPGHEIAGTVAAVGRSVGWLEVGEPVAVGWFGGSCGHCRYCRAGDVVHCRERRTPGRSYPGGWAQFVTVPVDAVVRIPDGMPFDLAAPFGCAGVTTFNAIRRAGVPAGGRVAVFGIGGLGHLALQFASALGYETVALARGTAKAARAAELGADRYVDTAAEAPAATLARLGGADLILYTASDTGPAAGLIDGLAVDGRLVLVGVDDGELRIPAADLVSHGHVVTGHLTGGPRDTEDAMRFAVRNGVRPVIERAPLAEAGAAVERLRAGAVRFRTVLDPWGRR